MTIDRARNSYNPVTRAWRAVLAQQGRVTLEADVNEQAEIVAETERRATRDIIGAVGTPDGGYQISVVNGAVQIGPGTLFLAGLRFSLREATSLASQPGWLDMPALPQTTENQVIALLALEQTVVAVEDQTLLEVALGGPDSAGRKVLLQHFVSLPSAANNCESAAAALPSLLAADGLIYDPLSCELTGQATLQVSPVEAATPAGPCDPPAAGGYLGADNQMIRVAITQCDANAQTLVWGLNNASFLFRATVNQDGSLTFLSDPLDPDHTPQAGQAVEILSCTVDLGDGHTSQAGSGNYIAAGAGQVQVLGAAPYNTASRQLLLPNPVAASTGPVFVRLWQEQLGFTAGVALPLGTTGLAVTIANPSLPGIGGRPYWQFAVRPATPQLVYPQAYLTAPQPPTGPRQFLGPLGVVGAGANGGLALLDDCSTPFQPLTKLHDCSCCSLVLAPDNEWAARLNNAIANPNITSLSVCFQPGAFVLAAKITVTGKSVRMTGAGAGTQLTGPFEALLEFDSCPDVYLADLAVTGGIADYVPGTASVGLQGAVTVRACNQVDIERVFLACADADLRASACLTVSNLPANTTPQQYNTRIRNSQFRPGHFQVGVLLVNADRAQVEGNLILTPAQPIVINLRDLGKRPLVAAQLRKHLVQELKITASAPPKDGKTTAARRRPVKPGAKAAARKALPSRSAAVEDTVPAAAAPAAPPERSQPNLTGTGRAQIRAEFGTTKLQFISSDKLADAWHGALANAGLTETARPGAIHRAVRKIAAAVVENPGKASPAFRNFISSLLPALYSVASQGIVVGGTVANDIRILNNTIDGSAQGIHVGLSDVKIQPKQSHMPAQRVQISGNTINIRLTPQTVGERHGIYLGSLTSAAINDNQLQLSGLAVDNANGVLRGTQIAGIKVMGNFGPLLLIERNCMLGFTTGILTVAANPQSLDNLPSLLWKASDNMANAAIVLAPGFTGQDNVT